MRRLFRWLLVLGLIGGVVTAIVAPIVNWWHNNTTQQYLHAKVSRGRVEQVVNSTGTVKPVRSVLVGAFVSGPIDKIYVDFNSVVKKDQILARIDPRLWQASVDRDRAALLTTKADLARIEALLQQAKNNEERARKLRAVNNDYLSDTEMDQYRFTRLSTEAQRDLALASINQAEANLKTSAANLDYCEIRAPVDGIVIERKVDPGQTVAASFQTPELFIVAPDMDKHMHVFASVDEADIGLIRTAQEQNKPVTFTVDAYPEDLFEGRIFQVRKSSSTTQNVVTYPVVIEAENPHLKLMPGMTANISFHLAAREDALRLPAAALRFVPKPAEVHPEDKHYLEGLATQQAESGTRMSAGQKVALAKARSKRIVWINDGKLLRAVPVTLGLTDNQFAEVLEGDLSDGQEVVTGTEDALAKAQT
jgi:HlyD family secretion protein